MAKTYRVSADIGGTFTDIVYQDVATGECHATKVLTTPENPALAVVQGIDELRSRRMTRSRSSCTAPRSA